MEMALTYEDFVNEVALSLLLTQSRKFDILRYKVTEMISLKKMTKWFIATEDDTWVEPVLRNGWIHLRPKYGNEVRLRLPFISIVK